MAHKIALDKIIIKLLFFYIQSSLHKSSIKFTHNIELILLTTYCAVKNTGVRLSVLIASNHIKGADISLQNKKSSLNFTY